MEGDSFLWLVRHAAAFGVDGLIHAANAPADLSDRALLDAVRRHLPPKAASYASPAQRTIDTARALGLDPVPIPEFAEQDFGAWTGHRHDDLAAAKVPLPAVGVHSVEESVLEMLQVAARDLKR